MLATLMLMMLLLRRRCALLMLPCLPYYDMFHEVGVQALQAILLPAIRAIFASSQQRITMPLLFSREYSGCRRD